MMMMMMMMMMMSVVKMVAEVAPNYTVEEIRVRKMIYRQVFLSNTRIL
jgi:hypothetical protein